jgi:DNA repair protein RecN (Recombination protein N)
MLSYLQIRDFGIFAAVQLELGEGLSVFTGETGAGKSMIVDAVMACLGERTSKDLIRTGADKATLELLADRPQLSEEEARGSPLQEILGDDREIVFQKDISSDRSYLRVNGRLVTSGMAREIGSYLVDIHGQQDQHSLARPQNYLGIIDSLDKERIYPVRDYFREAYREMQSILKRMAEFGTGEEERQREIDLLSFQVKEIQDAKLRDGEEEDLRAEYAILSSQKRLIELADEAYSLLYLGGHRAAAADTIAMALDLLKKASSIDPSAEASREAVAQVSFGLEAALDMLRAYRRKLDVEPDRLVMVSDRLDLLQRLKAKYGDTIADIKEFEAKSAQRLNELENAEETLAMLKTSLRSLEERMARTGAILTSLRREVASTMEQAVSAILGELGMPGARFLVTIEPDEDPNGIDLAGMRVKASPIGVDRVGFLFSANPGEPPMPVNRVASGGELSRLMLAVKSHLGEVDRVPTLIFDEIDAGIGGKTGQAVAERLWRVSQKHQVLCVTHLAAIAAMADNHYLVIKEERGGRTYASVRRLEDPEERVAEIARMLSGDNLSISIEHARALLEAAQAYKSSISNH